MRSRRASVRWPAPGPPDHSPTPPPPKAAVLPVRRTAPARPHRSGAIRAAGAVAPRARLAALAGRPNRPRRRQAEASSAFLLAEPATVNRRHPAHPARHVLRHSQIRNQYATYVTSKSIPRDAGFTAALGLTTRPAVSPVDASMNRSLLPASQRPHLSRRPSRTAIMPLSE